MVGLGTVLSYTAQAMDASFSASSSACQAERADGRIRHEQNGGNRLFAKERHDGSQTVKLHRLAIGKNRKRGTEHALKGAAEKGIGFILKSPVSEFFDGKGEIAGDDAQRAVKDFDIRVGEYRR